MSKRLARMPVASFAAVLCIASLCGGEIVPKKQPAPPPSKDAVAAARSGNEMAFDLYRQLAKDNIGENLFFSPNSISVALTMTAEGARGETAEQMGSVLHFPADTRQPGDAEAPWNMAAVHRGEAELLRALTPPQDPKVVAQTRKQIAALEKELAKQNRRLTKGFNKDAMSRANTAAKQINELRAGIDQYELNVANALWCEQMFPFRPAFLESLDDAYGAAAMPVDFRHAPDESRKRINAWVESKTNDRIKDLLAPGTVEPSTVLVLTNAIYFKGNWAEEFDPQYTKPADFTLVDGSTTSVPMMAAREFKADFAEFRSDGTKNMPEQNPETGRFEMPDNPAGVQFLRLPYRGKDLSMVILLPTRHDGLADLESVVTNDWLEMRLAELPSGKLNVYVPKFKLETEYELNGPLKALGMTNAFVPGAADFSGLSESAAGGEVVISTVVHKAFVDVNEKGTEAAAATAVAMVATALRRPLEFRADHPFLFAIRHEPTGALLFLGRVEKP